MNRTPQPWPAIKAAYQSGEGSIRELALRFGVSENTAEKRCIRERWRNQMRSLCGTVAEAAERTAVEQGAKLGMDAAALVATTVKQTAGFLGQIDVLAEQGRGSPDADQLGKVVSAWRDVVAVGRTAFRLDETTVSSIKIGTINAAIVLNAQRDDLAIAQAQQSGSAPAIDAVVVDTPEPPDEAA
jgi:transposase-like protein